MSFRRKTYPEVSDQLLNRMLGGVSGEAHAYPPPKAQREPFSHALAKAPAADITSLYGLANGSSARFAKGVDYELSSDGTRVVWKNGQRPDAGTVLDINYLPKQREVRVSDLFPGSVLRTLLEAVALETAGLYAQLEVAYRSAFIDTAEGSALDHVVAVLGVRRVRAGRNVAEVEFNRAVGARGDIRIPAGTRVLTPDGAIEYETVADIALSDGQPSGRGSARDTIATNQALPAGSLTLLAKPIAGVGSVENPSPSSALDRDESDEELRTRAKSFLAGSERGTLGALTAAVARNGVLADIDDSQPGQILVHCHSGELAPEHKKRLEADLEATRPAGVQLSVDYGAPPLGVDLELRLSTAEGLLPADLKRAQSEVRARLETYFAKLDTPSAASLSRIIAAATAVDGVEDVFVVSASVGGTDVLDRIAGQLTLSGTPKKLGQLTLVDPALATQLGVSVRYTKDVAIPNQAALQAAFSEVAAFLASAAARPDSGVEERSLSWAKLALAAPLPAPAPPATPSRCPRPRRSRPTRSSSS